MGRTERRKADKAERFQVKRATIGEAKSTRAFIEHAFRDRISWVAARVILAQIVANAAPVEAGGLVGIREEDLHRAIRFLNAHPGESVVAVQDGPRPEIVPDPVSEST